MKHMIILIDSSYSMWNRMENIVKSLNIFINNIKDKDLYITIAHFNHALHYVTKFQNISLIPTYYLKEFAPYGSTALYDVIYDVITEFGFGETIHHNLFIISDGDDTCSARKQDETNLLCEYAIKNNWDITHCNTDVSKLSVPTVVFDIDDVNDISNLFDRMRV